MPRRIFLAVGLGFLVAVGGCHREPTVRVQVPERLTLYSIDGTAEPVKEATTSGQTFHGYPVLGKVVIEDAKRRETLISVFNRGIARSDGTMAKCFWPRHGLRAEREGETTDYVICFECLQFAIHRGEAVETEAIDKLPMSAFNDELKRAGVHLAPSGIKGSE